MFACQLAEELGIAHRYCDPDKPTRDPRSIPEGKEGHPKRERNWVRATAKPLIDLQCFSLWGADHFESFRDLLRESRFEAVEVVRDWVPSDYASEMTI
jgi:hypothetical protein